MWQRAGAPAALAEAIGSHQPFYLPYQGCNDRELQTLYGSLVCKIMAARYPTAGLAEPAGPAASRSGSVSSAGFSGSTRTGKFRSRDGSKMLDRSRFHVSGYYTSAERDERDRRGGGIVRSFRAGPAVARCLAAHDPGRCASCSDFSRNRDGQGVGATGGAAARGGSMRFLGASGHQRISDHRLLHQQRSHGAGGRRGSLFRTADPAAESFDLLRTCGRSGRRDRPGATRVCAQMPWSIGAVSRCRNICRNSTRCSRASRPRFRTVSSPLSSSAAAGASPRCFEPGSIARSRPSVSTPAITVSSCRDWRRTVSPPRSVSATSCWTASAGRVATRSWRAWFTIFPS